MRERNYLSCDMRRGSCQHLHINLHPILDSESEVDQLIQTLVNLLSDYKVIMPRQMTHSYDALSSQMIPMNLAPSFITSVAKENMMLNENRKALSTEDNIAGVSV